MPVFKPTSILIPSLQYMEDWPVVACDQFSSQPEYWKRVEEKVKDKPSSLHLILPEAWLESGKEEEHAKKIPRLMQQYMDEGVLEELPDAFIYVERELSSHKIRRGLVGAVDLDAYSYTGEDLPIRATEKTIVERIPARAKIRQAAPLEIPHILLLADDQDDQLLAPLTKDKDSFTVLYDLDLMEDGGHLKGWLVDDAHKERFMESLDSFSDTLKTRYKDLGDTHLQFAAGDGNHSLAAAKALWEQIKPGLSEEEQAVHPARYALAELENIHDDSQEFEPIHRLLTETDPDVLLEDLKESICAENGYPLTCCTKDKTVQLYLDPSLGHLPVAILQSFLDTWLESHPGKLDYIHGDDTVETLGRQEKAVGFLLPAVDKSALFSQVITSGSLPRKTFSMGQAKEKRYYMEARKIVPDEVSG